MAFPEELISGLLPQGHTKRNTGGFLELVTGPPCEPVSLQEAKDHLYLTHPTAAQSSRLSIYLLAAREAIENYTNKCMITQRWYQIHSQVAPRIPYLRGPAGKVTNVVIEYIPTMEDDTWITYPSTGYIAGHNAILARTSWPSHRGYDSFRITYDVAYASCVANPTAEQITAAQNAVPQNLRLAVAQLAGFFFDNREGQGDDPKYDSTSKKYSSWPQGVQVLLQTFTDKRVVL